MLMFVNRTTNMQHLRDELQKLGIRSEIFNESLTDKLKL